MSIITNNLTSAAAQLSSGGAPLLKNPHQLTQLFQGAVPPNGQPPENLSLWHNFQKQARDVQNPDSPLLKSESFRAVLNEKFGEPLVTRMLKRYNLTDKTSLSIADYRAITIGIAAGVQRSDLEALFNKFKQNGDPDLAKFSSFDDVTDEQIARLHNHFVNPGKEILEIKQEAACNIGKILKIALAVFLTLACLALVTAGILAFAATFPMSAGLALAAIIVGSVGLLALGAVALHYKYRKGPGGVLLDKIAHPKAPNHRKSNQVSYVDNLNQDKDFLKTCKLAKVFNFEKNQNIAASEYLAHDVAYADLIEGQILPLTEKNNQTTYVKVSRIINKEGFVCFILTPLQEKQHLDAYQVRVLFRGTHDLKSLRRLAEPYSAGNLSFKHHQKELLETIAEVAPADAKHVHTEYYGHSLGGADAQRAAALTTFAKAKIFASAQVQQQAAASFNRRVTYFAGPDWGKIKSTVEKINVVKARFWNSAGVTHSTNRDFQHDVKIIGSQCAITLSECKVDGDFVQKTGPTTLGCGMGNVPNVDREVWLFKHGHGGTKGFLRHLGPMATVKAHQTKNLNRESNKGKDPEYFYANNRTNLAAVEKSNEDHLKWPGELWQKTKWFVMTKLFGSSLNYNGQFYNPFALPKEVYT